MPVTALEMKPDYEQAMQRIDAWYNHAVTDRAPVRFCGVSLPMEETGPGKRWPDLRARWFDAQYQVEHFLAGMRESSYLGETFPIFYPNLGPNAFAAMLGGELQYGDATSWMSPSVADARQISALRFDRDNPYYQKILEMTRCALEMGKDRFWVGYTDMHPGLDCADALMGTENVLVNMLDEPETVASLVERCTDLFLEVMKDYIALLAEKGQPSASWMQIPFYESMHIPSCDIGAMISRNLYREFALPAIAREVKHFQNNIFHLDGKDAVKHLDDLLQIDEIQAIQWVQGAGSYSAIAHWLDLIRRIQAAGKSVVVNLTRDELEPFIEAINPEGILLCIDETEADAQQAVIRRLMKWKRASI